MRLVILAILILGILGTGIGYGQAHKRNSSAVAAPNWVFVRETDSGQKVYINTKGIVRTQDVIVFTLKAEKRGTKVFSTVIGNCTSDYFQQLDIYAVYPNSPRAVMLNENTEPVVVSKGSDGYKVLDKACEYPQ